ncbi:hypothetical protein DFJ74DRAFT_679496 [Hyaloraphidium curvatum]|nr:hypothetical protein DFJ74DRAFT_679496 [Hyaloraphidium curvatum]
MAAGAVAAICCCMSLFASSVRFSSAACSATPTPGSSIAATSTAASPPGATANGNPRDGRGLNPSTSTIPTSSPFVACRSLACASRSNATVAFLPCGLTSMSTLSDGVAALMGESSRARASTTAAAAAACSASLPPPSTRNPWISMLELRYASVRGLANSAAAAAASAALPPPASIPNVEKPGNCDMLGYGPSDVALVSPSDESVGTTARAARSSESGLGLGDASVSPSPCGRAGPSGTLNTGGSPPFGFGTPRVTVSPTGSCSEEKPGPSPAGWPDCPPDGRP